MTVVDHQKGTLLTRASISEYRGNKRFDIRTMWNNDGEWCPTKKGAGVPLDVAEKYLTDCLAMVREAGE